MGAEPSDFRLEAYRSLREEIIHHVQAMSAVVGVALTAIGAIGAFALSRPSDKEALLVLPFVLSGLGLVQTNHGLQIRRRDEYIRTHIWRPPPISWEQWIADRRLEQPDWYPTKVVDAVGYIVIFAFPSVLALALTASQAWRETSLTIVWGLAIVVLLVAAGFLVAVQTVLAPSDEYSHQNPRPPQEKKSLLQTLRGMCARRLRRTRSP